MKLCIWNNLSPAEKNQTLLRPVQTFASAIKTDVDTILSKVKTNGDVALRALTQQYDKAVLENLSVTQEERQAAQTQISASMLNAINIAKNRIAACHQAQLPKKQTLAQSQGVFIERQPRAIERVGFYIPGGSAPLVSTVLMLGVPAQLAGNKSRILCTPPNPDGTIDPAILVAANLCGIENIYKVGGAQAIAAMAYGTESIRPVDKIFGPGNAWVTCAKSTVAQEAEGLSIDMPAGPSEVLVIADDAANPAFVAADLLSQAEHGPDSQVILIALSEEFVEKVQTQIASQKKQLTRQSIIDASLQHSRFIIVNQVLEAIEISNAYAPEHLILQVENPETYIAQVENAGTVFLGALAAESLGDYITGSNHVLPTSGYARTLSGLSVMDFMKYVSFQKISPEGLENIGPVAEQLATLEGLDAHKNAVALRLACLKEGNYSPLPQAAKAGTQSLELSFLDLRLRGDDGLREE